MLDRIRQFAIEMCKTWGALLTGGFIIAIIASWEFTGHSIPPKWGWSLIMSAIIVAAFQVWNRQCGLTKAAKDELDDSKDVIKNMRRALYAEIASIYEIIEPLTKPESDAAVSAILINSIAISTYHWAKSQPNIFFKLPEASNIENIYRVMEFVHSNLRAPVFAKQSVRMCTGLLLAVEAAVTQPAFHFDIKLFEQLSPSVYKLIIANAKIEHRFKKLLDAFPSESEAKIP